MNQLAEIHKEMAEIDNILKKDLNNGAELLIITAMKWPKYQSYCPRCGLVEEIDGKCPYCGHEF